MSPRLGNGSEAPILVFQSSGDSVIVADVMAGAVNGTGEAHHSSRGRVRHVRGCVPCFESERGAAGRIQLAGLTRVSVVMRLRMGVSLVYMSLSAQ